MSQMSLFESLSTSNSPAQTSLPWTDLPFLVVDTETTGLDRNQNRVIEIAWVFFDSRQEIHGEARFCQIDEPVPELITGLTGISTDMLTDQPYFAQHVDDFLEFASKAAYIVAYNASFDREFLEAEFRRANRELPAFTWVDPCVFIREFDRYQKGKKLTDAALRWGVRLDGAHRALADAKAAGHLLLKLMPRLKANSLSELITLQNAWQIDQERQYQAYAARKAK
ncbi:MAG: 3'-5' exonuclease [Myxococcaceae bacterium]|nr:3'-5' exonuclease [Myxococcaceae bacterium]